MYLKLLSLFLLLFLASCQGGPLIHFGPTPTPFPDTLEGKFQVGDHSLVISCEGSGEPTIILERGPWVDKGWDIYYDRFRFAKITRTCIYIRSGVDTGDTFTGPRTVMDQVKDLHALLEQTGVPGPYILASYHLASYNLILYTDQYPQDVAGLVAVDPWYPTYFDYCLGKLGPVTASTSAERKQLIEYINDYKVNKAIDLLWNAHPEYLDQRASDAQVLNVASLKDVPLTIVESEFFVNDFAEAEINQIVWETIQESSKDFCKLSSSCRMVKVPATDFLTISSDTSIDKAIQEMYDAVKKPK